MKKFLISIAAVGLLAGAAAPVMAQPYRQGEDRARAEYRYGLREGQAASARAGDALARANRALHSGRVSRRDTAEIRSASLAVSRARNAYSSRGWERWEVEDLSRKTDRLNDTIDRADSGRRGGRH